jgi:hypothetical protein
MPTGVRGVCGAVLGRKCLRACCSFSGQCRCTEPADADMLVCYAAVLRCSCVAPSTGAARSDATTAKRTRPRRKNKVATTSSTRVDKGKACWSARVELRQDRTRRDETRREGQLKARRDKKRQEREDKKLPQARLERKERGRLVEFKGCKSTETTDNPG